VTAYEPLLADSPLTRRNRQAIEQLVRSIQEGTYSAVLGPRLSGKTELLRFLEQTLCPAFGWLCAYVDLYDVRAGTLQGFFGELVRCVSHCLRKIRSSVEVTPPSSPVGSAIFRAFLTDAVAALEGDLILIIDHLEAMPTDLAEALLTSLRAAYMEQQTLDHRAVAIVSGALSLATLTVGESSPFRGIAHRVFVGDLSRQESMELLAEELGAARVPVTQQAARCLLDVTNGDPYLIRTICQSCVELARRKELDRLRVAHVQEVTRQFLEARVYSYAPLLEAVRLIEDDPDLLRCVLILLAHGTVAKAELPLPLSPDLDPLYLTGVVEQVDGENYRLQNRIYQEFLTRHFHPGRVGHLLAMAGHWDSALDYLEAGAREGHEQSRADLLPATINSMHAADDISQAAHFLARGLAAAFGVAEARIWYAPPQEGRLRLIGDLGPRSNSIPWSSQEMPLAADRLEARAFRQARALRGPEGERHVWRAIPLVLAGARPIGVVTLCDDLREAAFRDRRERDLQLLGYLHQAARALEAVGKRRQELALAGRMQVSLLPAALPEVSGWQFAATLRPARETSGDFYDFIRLPGGRLGLVVADVTDKGMGAALYMALSRTLIRTYAADHPDRPDLTLQLVSQRILADTQSGLFVTAFYGILDPHTGLLTYCNAGHPPPYLFGPDAGETPHPLPGRGMALGVVEDVTWGCTTIPIPPDSGLLLYSDGLADAENPAEERFGNDGIRRVIQAQPGRSAQELQEALLVEVQQFMNGRSQVDDTTLLIVRREPRILPPPRLAPDHARVA
jgi:energy-coupling factor transporter ATP-binding protein EcfA2